MGGHRAQALVLIATLALACAVGDKKVGDAGADAATDAPASDAGPAYADMTSPANWSFFHTETVDPNASGYFGSAFDGRYLYFTPVQNAAGLALEYDTQQPFGAAKSWSTFALGDDAGTGNHFVGAAFDGRYLFYPPFGQGASLLARYDTQAAYTSAGSWTLLDLTTVGAPAGASFVGGVYVGHHVYFGPYGAPIALAYDTTADLATPASWSSFDATALVGASYTSCSGATDGKYVYFAPFAAGAPSGLVLRADTSAFGAAGSWSTFDMTSLDPRATAYEGAVFDGRFVYFVPSGQVFTSGLAVRYDTEAPFATGASWSTFDIQSLALGAAGYVGGAFDGRYVYYVPYGGANGVSGAIARFDTLGAFGSASSWQVFDLTTLDPDAEGFASAAFDGRYLYLSPNLSAAKPGHVVARFDAKSPPSLPASYAGSFF